MGKFVWAALMMIFCCMNSAEEGARLLLALGRDARLENGCVVTWVVRGVFDCETRDGVWGNGVHSIL